MMTIVRSAVTLQHCPLNPHSNEVKASEVPKYVGKLKEFLGHEALAKAQADLDKDLLHHGAATAYGQNILSHGFLPSARTTK